MSGNCGGDGSEAGRLIRGLVPVTGAVEPECSSSRLSRVSSTRERSSNELRAHVTSVTGPLCKILPEVSQLLF